MARDEIKKLIAQVVEYQEACIAKSKDLTNEQLDTTWTSGTRQRNLRTALYNLSSHSREHSVHLQKILQKTGSPLAQPTEAQAILAKGKEAWGELEAVLACMDDKDLDRNFEGHSPRIVLEHLRDAHKSYLAQIEEGIQAAKK